VRRMTVVPSRVAFEIADTLASSGVVGVTLAKLLHGRFPTGERAEVFFGVAFPITDHGGLLIQWCRRRRRSTNWSAWAP
jgi:hypothetical protein